MEGLIDGVPALGTLVMLLYRPQSYQTANTLLIGAERVIVIWLTALAVLEIRFSVGMLFAFMSRW